MPKQRSPALIHSYYITEYAHCNEMAAEQNNLQGSPAHSSKLVQCARTRCRRRRAGWPSQPLWQASSYTPPPVQGQHAPRFLHHPGMATTPTRATPHYTNSSTVSNQGPEKLHPQPSPQRSSYQAGRQAQRPQQAQHIETGRAPKTGPQLGLPEKPPEALPRPSERPVSELRTQTSGPERAHRTATELKAQKRRAHAQKRDSSSVFSRAPERSLL